MECRSSAAGIDRQACEPAPKWHCRITLPPDVDSLALCVRSAERRKLARAAQANLITVPTASRLASLLEHPFRVRPFECHSRGVDPSPAS